MGTKLKHRRVKVRAKKNQKKRGGSITFAKRGNEMEWKSGNSWEN